jgi:hypothetical protein
LIEVRGRSQGKSGTITVNTRMVRVTESASERQKPR